MDHVEDKRPPHCTACGSTALEQGFVFNRGKGAGGWDDWISGAAEVNTFTGVVKRMRERKHGRILAHRCQDCSHLEHYVELQQDPEY